MPIGGLTTRGPRNLLRQIREAMAGAAPAQQRDDARSAELAKLAQAQSRLEVELDGARARHDRALVEARAALEFETKLEAARTMAKNDPKAIAEVIKHWVNGDE